MSATEQAKEITIALISKVSVPGKQNDEQYPSKWVAQAYKIILDAVLHPELEKN